MKKLAFSLCLLITLPLWAQEPVGQVVDLVGSVWVTHRGAKPIQALFRESIYLGDEIQTKLEGGVKILFRDDTLLTVKENSKVLITEFLFNPAEKTRKISFDATFGSIRAIVGKFFGKDQLIEIKTPTAVAGIRGTDLGALIERKMSSLYCFKCDPALVETYNTEFPGERVALKSGETIEVLAGRAAAKEHISAIPKDIIDQIDILFDIQKGAAAETTRQASSESAKTVASETRAATPAITAPGTTKEGLMEKATAARNTAETTEIQTPTTTDSTTAEIISGGEDEASSGGVSIKITLPSH